VGALGLASCGGGKGRDDVSAGATSKRHAAALAPAEALSAAPLAQLPGSFFVADTKAAWYTDFTSLARFDIASGEWAKAPLPFDPATVHSVAFLPDGSGQLDGVATICPKACGDSDGPSVTLQAWHADATGSTSVLKLNGLAPLDPDDNHLALIGTAEGTATFRALSGATTVAVTITGDSATATALPVPLPLVCPVDGGYLAVEDDATSGQPIAPKSIVSGPDLASLAPVATGSAAAALLNDVSSSTACTPEGLAIVGPTSAWQATGLDASWTAVPSDVGIPLGHQLVAGVTVADGTDLWSSGVQADLKRDPTGWHLAAGGSDRPSAYANLGGSVIEFPSADKRQSPPPPSVGTSPLKNKAGN
jgi:hypothetical protein